MKAISPNAFWRRLAGPALVTASMLVSSAVSATTLNGAYWNWFDLAGGAPGGYVSGGVWTDLSKAPVSQAGDRVSLAVNTSLCQDNLDSGDAGGITYWCDDKKWVEMLTYETVLVPAGDPSVATFSGCFGDSDMPGNTAKAFVKILAEDYSATYAEEFSADAACWDISFDILGDAAVQVQKGFQVLGPNADPRDGDAGAIVAYIGATQNPDSSSAVTDPTGIPVLPLWALFGLAGLIGLMGLRRKA